MANEEAAELPEVKNNGGIRNKEAGRKASLLRIKVVDNAKDGHPAVNYPSANQAGQGGMKIGEAFPRK